MKLSSRAIGSTIALIILTSCVLHGPRVAAQTADDQAAYEQALQLLQNGKNAEALAVIEAGLSAGASDPALYNLKGLAASELGRYSEAEESFRTVIRLTPDSATGYVNLGVLLSKLSRSQDAVTTFRAALAREPKSFTALLGLGTSLADLHQYDEAATYLQKAWAERPGDFQTGYEWTVALRAAGKPAAAKKVLGQILAPADADSAAKYFSLAGVVAEDLKDMAAAAHFYRRAYEINPTSYELYLALVRTGLAAGGAPFLEDVPTPPPNLGASQNLALGLLYMSGDAYPQAIARFEETLRQDAWNNVATLNLALAYKNISKAPAAIDLLRRTLAIRPAAGLYDLLGGLDEESDQYLDAVQSYQRAVELDPSNEQYYFDLGMEYLAHFTFGPALEVYRVGTRKFPKSSRQYLGLAFSHYSQREYTEAADAFTTALEIDPEGPGVFQGWKTVLSFLVPKDWEPLLPRLSRLADGHPQSAELAFAYGAAAFRSELAKGQKGSLDRALTFLQKAVRLQPDFPDAHLELGGLYAARKEDQKAVDEYQETIRQNPKSDIAHYRLGQVYRQMNNLPLATQELTRYQELTRIHAEELKRGRSAVKQFVLSPPAKPTD